MGNVNSSEDPYGYYGSYGYSPAELERYYRRYYPQYNAYSTMAQYGTPTNYYNAYQQQQLYPSTMMNGYSPAYTGMGGYGLYGVPAYQSMYNTPVGYSAMYSGGMPTYGTYNNTYYPNYLQRTYM